jgi:hypothetical protein
MYTWERNRSCILTFTVGCMSTRTLVSLPIPSLLFLMCMRDIPMTWLKLWMFEHVPLTPDKIHVCVVFWM